ncbi:unnamed protein product [Dovyalis caffra]|uniref:Uncharacterized protein n=1 Tax=Dovyalis caffra TaxID=77055 RepID=A0AAV1R8W1_9ROSI|nr:unnamed protein product [Dovyalis caffra]
MAGPVTLPPLRNITRPFEGLVAIKISIRDLKSLSSFVNLVSLSVERVKNAKPALHLSIQEYRIRNVCSVENLQKRFPLVDGVKRKLLSQRLQVTFASLIKSREKLKSPGKKVKNEIASGGPNIGTDHYTVEDAHGVRMGGLGSSEMQRQRFSFEIEKLKSTS